MTKSYEHLPILIQALDPGEKRFFRQFAGRHPGTNAHDYHRLFEAMENGEAIATADKGPKAKRNLTLLRNYLQKMVLQRRGERYIIKWHDLTVPFGILGRLWRSALLSPV